MMYRQTKFTLSYNVASYPLAKKQTEELKERLQTESKKNKYNSKWPFGRSRVAKKC